MSKYAEPITGYFGYYHSILIAVSDNPDVIKFYFTNHRHLTKDEFTIKERLILENDLYLRYDDEYMTEWNGYIIPTIDILLIDMYARDIVSEIDETIQNLKHLALLSEGVKKVPIDYINSLVKSIKALHEMRAKPKILKKLDEREKLENSILYEPMSSYIKLKDHVLEMRDARTRWWSYE